MILKDEPLRESVCKFDVGIAAEIESEFTRLYERAGAGWSVERPEHAADSW